MHFLHAIWLYLHHIIPMVSLAATVGLPTLGGTESASTESTTDTTTDTTADGTTETAEEGGDGGTEGEGTDTQQAKPATEEKVDWRSVPPEVKGHLTELAKTNPTLANKLQNAIYTSQSFLKQFPGGLKEAQGLRKEIDDAGGMEEIKQARATNRAMQLEQEDLDGRARSGDPMVLDNLIEIAGDGFPKLMPVAMERWAAQDNAGYSHVMSKVMVEAFRQNGLVANLNLAVKMLGLKNEAATTEGIKALQTVADWVNSVGAAAAKAPEKPQIDPAHAAEQTRIDGEKTQIFNDRFENQFTPWRNTQIKNLLTAQSKGRTFSDYQVGTFGNKVVEEVRDVLKADKDYTQDLQRIYNSRDLDALLKFTRSRTEKVLPNVVEKVYRALFSNPTATKVKDKPKTATATAAATAAVPAVKGWVKLSQAQAPNPSLIDNKQTTFEMKYDKQAILLDGRKVYWGSKIPK